MPLCWSGAILKLPAFDTTSSQREHARHARDGALVLQTCEACGEVQYPTREVCRRCLAGTLSWAEVPAAGRVVSTAIVHASLHPEFRERSPWRICSVLLDAGPVVIAHAADGSLAAGDAVDVHDRIVGELRSVLVAAKRNGVKRERK